MRNFLLLCVHYPLLIVFNIEVLGKETVSGGGAGVWGNPWASPR